MGSSIEHLEPEVMAIVEQWSRVRRVNDPRAIARKIRSTLQMIDYGMFDCDPEIVAEAGGAAKYLYNQTKAYADSDAGRGPMQYRLSASAFFNGRFTDDPSEWVREDRQRPQAVATARTDAWRTTAATWATTIADRRANGSPVESLVSRAIEYMRRDGFTGTDTQAMQELGCQ